MLRKYVIAVFLGLLFSLGFAPNDLWFVSLLSLTCLHFLIQEASKKELFYIGYFYGFGLWSLGISWVYVSIYFYGNIGFITSIILTIIFIAILSLYLGVTLLLYHYLRFNSKFSIIFSLPLAWIVVEYLRSILFTGFPWLISGTMLADTSIDGWTPIIGAQGNTFLLLLLSSLLFLSIKDLKKLQTALLPLIFFVLLFISSFTLKQIEWTTLNSSIKASIIQPNLELEKKWSTEGIIETKNMMEMAIENAEEGEIIVFPETALILSQNEIKDWIAYIDYKAEQKKITLITGIIEREEGSKVRNRILGLGAENWHYDKVKLVPFGEFIPFENIAGKFFDILGLKLTNTVPGKLINSISSGNISISPSICYEIAFPELIRKTASESNLLVTVSNDTWFGSSYGPIQHLEIAQNRALEHKKAILRSTNTGISAFISNNGKILEKQGYFEDKILRTEVNLYEGKTFYAKYGNLPLYLILSVIFIIILILKRKKEID